MYKIQPDDQVWKWWWLGLVGVVTDNGGDGAADAVCHRRSGDGSPSINGIAKFTSGIDDSVAIENVQDHLVDIVHRTIICFITYMFQQLGKVEGVPVTRFRKFDPAIGDRVSPCNPSPVLVRL